MKPILRHPETFTSHNPRSCPTRCEADAPTSNSRPARFGHYPVAGGSRQAVGQNCDNRPRMSITTTWTGTATARMKQASRETGIGGTYLRWQEPLVGTDWGITLGLSTAEQAGLVPPHRPPATLAQKSRLLWVRQPRGQTSSTGCTPRAGHGSHLETQLARWLAYYADCEVGQTVGQTRRKLV